MRFSIQQAGLLPSLQAVARSCGFRSQLPVLGNILLSSDQGKLKLAATNLEIGVVKLIKADFEEEGEVTVPAKTLVDIVVNLDSEKIDFISSADQLEVKTPNFLATINGISASEFPVIPLSGKEAVKIDPKILAKALPQVSFAAAVDEGRPILTGILTKINHKKLELVATDGYRLAHKVMEVEEESEFIALVPRRTFEEVLRLISEDEADVVNIALSEDGNQIIFSFGSTKISSRLIEGQFPAWEKIVPNQIKGRVVAEKGEVLKSVKLASVFARSDNNIIKLQNLPGKIVYTSEAKEMGSQKKETKAEVEGEEINIAFNAKFLQDALSALNSNQIMMEFSGNLSATVIKPVGEAGLQYIIMPVNLS